MFADIAVVVAINEIYIRIFGACDLEFTNRKRFA